MRQKSKLVIVEIETTGYVGIDVFAGTGGASVYGGTGQTDGWGPSSWTSNSNILFIQGELFRVHGNKWTCDSMAQNNMTLAILFVLLVTKNCLLNLHNLNFYYLLALLMIATVIYA